MNRHLTSILFTIVVFLPVLFLTPDTVQAGSGEGIVFDSQERPIPGAKVEIRTAGGISVYTTASSESGNFSLPQLSPGRYRLVVKARHFTDGEMPFDPDKTGGPIVIRLSLAPIRSTITVAAERGSIGDTRRAAQVIAVGSDPDDRPVPDPGHMLIGSPGILVQQTTSGQVSPFLRGLTGYHVLNLIDGIRFNNSSFRSGPNQYLALIDPSQQEHMEAVLGPAGVEYGSDAIGGAIYLSTPSPRFSQQGPAFHGDLLVHGVSADLSGGSSLKWGLSGDAVSWLSGISARRANDLRAGKGEDSHHALRRYLGLDSSQVRELTGDRLQDTSYSQQGIYSKLAFRLPDQQHLYLWYQGSRLNDVRGYKDLWGGLGRLQSFVTPQSLHFGYLRYEKFQIGFLDSLSGTVSINSQRDGSLKQGLKTSDTITAESNRIHSNGLSLQATAHIGSRQFFVFGAEHYREKVRTRREEMKSSSIRSVRPLYPDGSRYSTTGLFLQEMFEPVHRKVRWVGGLRYTGASFQSETSETYGIRAASSRFHDLTFQSALSWRINDTLGVHFSARRGFRAPNLNDLGAIGLNDLGYEIPAAEASSSYIGSSSGESAVSTGKQVRSLLPESLYNLESGITLEGRHFHYRIQGFYASFRNPIVRRTLLYDVDSVPASVAGIPVRAMTPTSAQAAQGVVPVSPLFDSRAIKAFVNDGQSLYTGIESQLEWTLTSQWRIQAGYSFLVGRDLFPTRAIRRLPPQSGSFSLHREQRRFWGEVRMLFAGSQRLLSGGDLDDERIGASRSRNDIASFFRGARMATWLDDQGRFRPTGETLTEIQNRTLPIGSIIHGVLVNGDSTRVPLYTATPSYWTIDLQGGIHLSENTQLGLGLTNLADRNYRTHGSGIDGAGRSVYLSLHYRF